MAEKRKGKKTKEERIAEHTKRMKDKIKDYVPGGVFMGEGKKEKKNGN